MPHSGVQLRLDRQGGVCVQCGSTDIGQGSDSVLAYVVAEILGIDPFDIRVVTADTDLTPVDLGSYSSRVTLMTGNAAIQAAERARELLTMAVAEKLSVPVENLSFAERRVFDVENPDVGVEVRHNRHGRLIRSAALARKVQGRGRRPLARVQLLGRGRRG
jgi:CO/xanthine dehydrogenase Mo-binding subunit